MAKEEPKRSRGEESGRRGAEPRAQRPAPGKVTRTSKLAAGPGQPVQRKERPAAATSSVEGVQSLWQWTMDPWMDAAHRGTPVPAAAGQAAVQARGRLDAPDAESVHQAAAAGVHGSGSALPHLDRIQESFGPGHDLSGVRAHVGGAAAEASERIGAEAYATGDSVAFRAQPDLHTAAHEAAHVVQQRAGVQLAGGVGRAGDAYERHADQVAAAVVAGRSAEGLLAGVAGQGAGSHAIQRFESSEHKHIGDEGTRTAQGQTRTVEVAPGYFLTFGDLTAMAGDYFESVQEIERLAANDGQGAGTREEIEYVRVVKVHGNESAEERYSQAARDAVDARYYRLAGNNSSHFTEPLGRPQRSHLNNTGNYRDNHENAIREAARAAVEGRSIDRALLCEGFASHFLTDAYAGGHVRTERISISDWWNPRVPMFWTNLKLFIAEQMAGFINDHGGVVGALTVQQLWEAIRASIEAKDLPTLTFGDLVSGAVHDYDNKLGVETQHGRLVGDGRLRDEEGREVVDPERGGRVLGARHTEDLAIVAVRLSLAEVEQAFRLGTSQTAEQIIASLGADGGAYAAERIWPRARPDSQQSVPRPRWQQPDVDALLADATMQQAILIFAREKADTLDSEMSFEDQTGVSAVLQKRAFRERVTNPLRNNPIATLRRLIDYTPNTGGGVAGHDTDDNATEYVGMMRDQGAMGTLTQTQRTRLIRDLIEGACGDDEEQAVIDLLRTCSVSMMTAIVRDLGGGDVEEGIGFLDSGVDGAEWTMLEGMLRRAPQLGRHI